MTTAYNAWEYRPDVDYQTGNELVGYRVEATDGHIGKVDEDTREADFNCIVVDTGPWIFGKKVMLPAGTVQRIDHSDQKIYVDRTKEQIKQAPEFDADTAGKPDYRDRLGTYYDDTYRTM